ncbi:MAG: RraA family protein [Pseudonocardia sediminis]
MTDTLDDTGIARLAALPTAAVSDALDRLGLDGQLEGITALQAGQRICGPAFTVSYEPITDEPGTVGDFLDDVPAGAVVVIDNAGRTDCTVWGGIMTGAARARGVGATVVHGACRDVSVALGRGYPIWSTGHYMRTGKGRVRMVGTGRELTIGCSRVAPGDLICGDADGVLSVPAGRARAVLELAEEVEATESRIVDALQAGSSLREARSELGYHDLRARR